MEDNWGRWTPDIKDGSMSGGSDFEVIEEKEEEESQQQPNAEVGENGQQRSMVAAEDVNVPTGNGVELGWHMDNLNLGNMKRTMQLEKQLLEERLLTSEMKVAKLEAEKSELNTRLEMMELKASKSGEENELLKQKLEQFGTSIGKLEELKLNARLGEEFQAFKEVVLEQAKQQAEKSALQQNKLEKQLLEERLQTSEMKVAKLEAEKSELNTKLEMMELNAGKSGEENELLKQKLEQFGTSIGKLEELKLNARLGEEFQAFKEVVLEQAKQQVEKESARQQSKLKEAIAQTEAKFSIKMTEIRRENAQLQEQLQTVVAASNRMNLQANKLATALGTQGKEIADLKGTVGELVRALDQQSTKTKQLDLQLTKFKEDIQRLDNKLPAAVKKPSDHQQQGIFMFKNVSLVQFPVSRLIASGSAWKFGNDFLTVTTLIRYAWASAFAERPFPVSTAAAHLTNGDRGLLFYFEVTVLHMTGRVFSPICVGLSGHGFGPCHVVGSYANSYAICTNGSYAANGKWQADLSGGFGIGDVVGFGMLLLPFEGSRLFFTKNGRLWGSEVQITSEQMKGDFYPTVSAFHAGTAVKVNLGGNLATDPFRYNLSHLKQISI